MQPGEECERASPVSRRSIKIVLEFNPAEQRDEPLTAGRRIVTNLAGFPYWKRYRYDNNDLAGEKNIIFLWLRPFPPQKSPAKEGMPRHLSSHGARDEKNSHPVDVASLVAEASLDWLRVFFSSFLCSARTLSRARRTLRELARGPRDMTSHGVAPLKYAGTPKSTRPPDSARISQMSPNKFALCRPQAKCNTYCNVEKTEKIIISARNAESAMSVLRPPFVPRHFKLASL